MATSASTPDSTKRRRTNTVDEGDDDHDQGTKRARAAAPPSAMATVALDVDQKRALVPICCSLAMSAAQPRVPPSSPFLLSSSSSPSPSAAVFAFPPSWSAEDWLLPGVCSPFGETEADLSLFPSLRSVGNDVAAAINGAFLRTFKQVLQTSRLQAEVNKALHEKKQIVFTGHSSGGSVAVLAAIWLLEKGRSSNSTARAYPFCVTFGSPVVGDGVFVHAIQRENWSCCFLNFIMELDMVPRCSLTPLSSFKEEFQSILNLLCSRSLCIRRNTTLASLVKFFYGTVLMNACSISSHQACSFMGSTNPLLEVMAGFVKLSPYRPFGTYVFCSNQGRLLCLKNSNAILQLLFYSFQLSDEEDATDVGLKSLQNHLSYDPKIKDCLGLEDGDFVDFLEAIPLSFSNRGTDEMQQVRPLSKDFELSLEARLCLQAAKEWENQRLKNQAKIDSNYRKIQDAIDFLKDYRLKCEMRGLGYYDTFKLQKDPEDFNANVKRLELAGLWDEIVEMLRRYELPDGFEGREEWVRMGTTYRRLVEPLDIANYYRHSKNEDTGPYMVKGRPRRYRYTQRWLEHAERLPSKESCFWAMVEELSIDTSSNNKPFSEAKSRVMELEKDALTWINTGKLGKDALLSESTFVRWWMALPQQHRADSCIAKLIHGHNMH